MDLQDQLADLDLVETVEDETGYSYEHVAHTHGGEWAGPCPFCSGGDDRFRIWPDHPDQGKGVFWCRRCETSGDALDVIQGLRGCDFQEAKEILDLDGSITTPSTSQESAAHESPSQKSNQEGTTFNSPSQDVLSPPPAAWQKRGKKFVEGCHQKLFSSGGQSALEWLTQQRCLNKEILREAQIGFHPEDRNVAQSKWGLSSQDALWLPKGIVIPYFIDGQLWAINIRRAQSDPKYALVEGSRNALYRADTITCDQPVVLVEGELDALSVEQETPEAIQAAAVGSTHGARDAFWTTRLCLASEVLLAFDRDTLRNSDDDESGASNPYTYWENTLPHAKKCPPWWEDPNQMLQDGANLWAWVNGSLSEDLPNGQSVTQGNQPDSSSTRPEPTPEDPRPDLSDDHEWWDMLLRRAYEKEDGGDGVLEGLYELRRKGARLMSRNGNILFRLPKNQVNGQGLESPWETAESFRDDFEDHLKDRKDQVEHLLALIAWDFV